MSKVNPPLPDDHDRFMCPFCGGKAQDMKIWYGMGYSHVFHCWRCRRYGQQIRDDVHAAWNSFCESEPAAPTAKGE